MPFISVAEKARSVCVRTLPAFPDDEPERGHGLIIGRFESDNDVILTERPVQVLQRSARFFCRSFGCFTPFERFLDVGNPLPGEARKHDIIPILRLTDRLLPSRVARWT